MLSCTAFPNLNEDFMKQFFYCLLLFPLFLSAYYSQPDNPYVPIRVNSYPPLYYPPSCHWLSALSGLGKSLEIEDGSIWKIDQHGHEDVFYWRVNDPLVLTQNRDWFSSFEYRLVNQATGGSIAVNLFLGPILASQHTRFVSSIDITRGEVILTDSSRWIICPSDISLFHEWVLNDCILIGSNCGWEPSYDFILINSNTNDFVRARQF